MSDEHRNIRESAEEMAARFKLEKEELDERRRNSGWWLHWKALPPRTRFLWGFLLAVVILGFTAFFWGLVMTTINAASGDGPVVKIQNRRIRKPSERLQFWLNVIATVMLGVPMVIESLKPYLPEHYYGISSSVFAVVNAGIGIYRLKLARADVIVDADEA